MAYAAIGSSVAAACVVATAYWLMGFMNIAMGRISKYWIYYLMGTAALVRGVAMVVRGISITQDEASKGMSVLYFMCVQAGFGLSLDMQCLVIAEWFKNTHTKHRPPLAKLWQVIATLGGPCAILTGPGLGVANAVLVYGYGTTGAIQASITIRRVSATGLFSVAAVCTLLALGATVHTVRRMAEFAPWDHPHQKVAVLMVTSALLAWAGATRVATQFTEPQVASKEALFYTMQVLPEMLQMAIWCIPYLVAEAHHSCGFDEWWAVSRHGKSASGNAASAPDASVSASASDLEAGKAGSASCAKDTPAPPAAAGRRTLTMMSAGDNRGEGAGLYKQESAFASEKEGTTGHEGEGGCEEAEAQPRSSRPHHPPGMRQAASAMDLAGLSSEPEQAAAGAPGQTVEPDPTAPELQLSTISTATAPPPTTAPYHHRAVAMPHPAAGVLP